MCTIRHGLDAGIVQMEKQGMEPSRIHLSKEQWEELKNEMEHLTIQDADALPPAPRGCVGAYRGVPVFVCPDPPYHIDDEPWILDQAKSNKSL